jgi:very-short-patch-repair endonuclease
VAERQRGVVSRTQLLCVGLTKSAISVRVARSDLHREHRGVYRVGHRTPLSFSREMAAALAAGTRAVVSHRSAGHLWALLPAPSEAVDLTGPPRAPRLGLRWHRLPIEPRDVTRCRGIPVTNPLRTVLDLAADLKPDELERVVAEAERRHLVTLRALESALDRRPRCHGAPALRAVLRSPPAFTRSEAERRLLALVRAAALPAPDHNLRVAGHERDLVWLEQGLVVETDGWEHHGGRAAFESDRRRDAELVAQGLRTMRFTWRQLSERPHEVVARLARALAQPGGRPGS